MNAPPDSTRGEAAAPKGKRTAPTFVPPAPPTLAYATPRRRRRPWIVRKWTLFREEAGITLTLLPAGLLIMFFFLRWGLGWFVLFSRALK